MIAVDVLHWPRRYNHIDLAGLRVNVDTQLSTVDSRDYAKLHKNQVGWRDVSFRRFHLQCSMLNISTR